MMRDSKAEVLQITSHSILFRKTHLNGVPFAARPMLLLNFIRPEAFLSYPVKLISNKASIASRLTSQGPSRKGKKHSLPIPSEE